MVLGPAWVTLLASRARSRATGGHVGRELLSPMEAEIPSRAGWPGQGSPWLDAGGRQCCPARYSTSSRAMGPRAGWPLRVASKTI